MAASDATADLAPTPKLGQKELLEASAAQGHPAAMFNLGVVFVNGDGVPVNLLKAREIWERASLTSTTARTHLHMLNKVAGGGVGGGLVCALLLPPPLPPPPHPHPPPPSPRPVLPPPPLSSQRMALECPLVGHRVRIEGTNLASLDGKMGMATGYDPGAKMLTASERRGTYVGRYTVRLDSGETFRIKRDQLRRVGEEGGSGGGGEQAEETFRAL